MKKNEKDQNNKNAKIRTKNKKAGSESLTEKDPKEVIIDEVNKLNNKYEKKTEASPKKTVKSISDQKAIALPKKTVTKKYLPFILAKFKFVMPQQRENIKLIYDSDFKAIICAFVKENSQILLVLLKDREKIIDHKNLKLSDIYQTAVYCQIKNNPQDNKNASVIKELFIGAIKRVKINKIELRDDVWYGEYINLVDVFPENNNNLIKIIHKITELLSRYFAKRVQIPAEIMRSDIVCDSDEIKTFMYAIANTFSTTPDELQAIFRENNFEKRVMLILKLLKKRIYEKDIDRIIDEKINESINKTQKEFYLREKIKVIREQLGDTIDKKSESAKIKQAVAKRNIPKSVKKKIYSELSKYEDTSAFSSENSVIKAYIDWLVDLPWDRKSEVKINIPNAYAYLNRTHYGLEKPKHRIIEELAVQYKTKNNNRGAIICLIGPPGVGKTSLARSIATVTNRKFIKMSLGGIKDESEIRGHRRTYVGAMPGRIIQLLKKVNVKNPLFLLDEIDKMASDLRGDPASAMLEVLDPEQNKFFSDNYIEENFDLSDVMFVATANNASEIPSALRDRLEIIYLHSYTEHEKFEIASQFLIPKIIKKNGLQKQNLKIGKKIIMNIILNYTMESGVRQLEREIDTICRKIVVQAIVKKDQKYTGCITTKNIDKYLGIMKYDYTKKSKKSLPGSVTGLAWTQYGGDILPIEVSMSQGSGKLNITGNLGDVMKESVQIALSFIKSHTHRFKIKDKFFDKYDIHLNVPEGAIPKDGPSAGITITTALLSLFKNKAISSSVAMTGEITLIGNVLEVGGLKEKLISASRSRLKTVFVPKRNIKDLQEIPQEILKNLIIYPIENYLEIYRHLFSSEGNKPFKLQELVTTNFFPPNIFTNINIQNL